MKKLLNLSIVLVMLLGLLPARAAIAEVMPLWEQLPGGDTGVSSQYYNWFVADDFVFSEAETIGVVEFWTSYLSLTKIHVEFYKNTPDGSGNNIPGGDPIYSEIFSDSIGTVEDSAVCSLSHCAYRHTLRLSTPVALAAGQHWVSIFGEDLLNWSNDSSTVDGSYKAAYWWNDTWNLYKSNLAFRLLEPQQTCPASVEVTSTADSGTGSLRQAIADVCPGGTITFAESLSGGTITLTTVQLDINKSLTIDGSMLSEKVTISGDNSFKVFVVNGNYTISLDSLIISGGDASYSSGGGIYNIDATVDIRNSILKFNKADNDGGAIYNDGGTVKVMDSILELNYANGGNGGGIYNKSGTLDVTNSTLLDNYAYGGGGGIATYIGTITTITGSTLAQNDAEVGPGGGLFNFGTATVVNSTFFDNAADYGGGIFNGASLTLYNSTLSGNSTFSSDSGTLDNETVKNGPPATLTMANTIIANSFGNSPGVTQNDCVNTDGTISENTNNLVGDGTCSAGAVNPVSGDPMLAALADNGGPTQTMALLPGSPAIDAGDDTICSGTLVGGVDQRGVTRPQPEGGACDIGAFEYDGEVTSPNQPPVAPDATVAIYGWNYNSIRIDIPPDLDSDYLAIDGLEQADTTYGTISEGYVSCTNPEDYCVVIFYYAPPNPLPAVEAATLEFRYKLYDLIDYSNWGTVTLRVGNVPKAFNLNMLAANNADTLVTLEGWSKGSTDLTFTIVDQPGHGTLLDVPTTPVCEPYSGGVERVCTSTFTYQPDSLGFTGVDQFTYIVNNGVIDSLPATALLYVQEGIASTAYNAIVPVTSAEPIRIKLTVSDPNIELVLNEWDEPYYLVDKLSFNVVSEPAGTFGNYFIDDCFYSDAGQICEIIGDYTPPAGSFIGDSFTFKVNDGSFNSNIATVTFIPRAEPKTLWVNVVDDDVDDACDASHCSLREAVQVSIRGDVIEFGDIFTEPQVIYLEQGPLLIDNDLVINGTGAQQLTISGSERSSVILLHGVYLTAGNIDPINVTISGVTIKDGRAREGGGINKRSNVTLVMNDCVIGPNNIVTEAGGGIANRGDDLTLNRCTVVGNHGTGSWGGAGIFAYREGVTTLINSTVTDNVTNNYGGGILVAYDATVNLIHSTISGNTANQDYADYEWGGGGGIYIVPGEYGMTGGTVNIHNSIVAGNTDLSGLVDPRIDYDYHVAWPDIYGAVNDLGGNLIGDSTGSTGWVDTDLVGTASVPIEPLLGELAMNAPGSTPTFALLTDSPAIDAVECPAEVTTDQRGVTRPQDGNGDGLSKCDIGAFELEYQEILGESQLTSARTKCSIFADGTAVDLERLFYAYTTKKGIDTIKSITPSTFLYYVKAVVPAKATTLVISQENDGSNVPAMGASLTLYDENCARLSPQAATVTISEGNITIAFIEGATERVIIAAVKYSARPIIGQDITGLHPFAVDYTFSAAMIGEDPFTEAILPLEYKVD